jgi:heme/copper-type cytochrome/quinol oxidase subunit 2
MIRLTAIAVAAVAITALLAVGAVLLASSVMRVAVANHEQWWWPFAMNGIFWMTIFIPVGIALRQQRVRARQSALNSRVAAARRPWVPPLLGRR